MPLTALVLAAGEGTRLRPLTPALPKPLAPVLGRPVAALLIERLGFCDEVAVNLHHGADVIERVLGEGPRYIREPELRGTAGALTALDGPVLVASSDGVHEVDLEALVAAHESSGAAATITVKRIERPETCALVELDGDRVVRFEEKPAPTEVWTDLASIGIYCFEPEAIARVPRDRPSDIARDLIPALLDHGQAVAAYETDAWWSDIGSPDELLAANLHLAGGGCLVIDSEVDPSARLDPPVVAGPGSQIGPGAHVARALVLPGATAGGVVEDEIHGTGEEVLRQWLS